MKKKITALGAVLAALTVALSGCGGKETSAPADKEESPVSAVTSAEAEESSTEDSPVPEEDDIAPYKEILDAVWLIAGGYMEDGPEGTMGVWEAANMQGNAQDAVGYALKDVTGDGSPELLIGAVDGGQPSAGSILYAVYTLAEEGPYCALSGWYRNAYYLTDRGFFYSGSGGAIYTTFGSYILSGDGRFPICTDYYFSKEKNEDFTEVGYYHNTTGYWDPDVSQEMTEEDFFARYDELSGGIISAELTPVSAYEFTGEIPEKTVSSEAAAPVAATVGIRAAEDQLQYYPEYAWFAAEDTPYAEEVLLTAENGSVKDVKVYALELHSADDENIYFTCEELFALDELTVERPLALKVSFPGSIPLYGISYTDTDGETVWRSLNMSGKDGSYYLNIFSPAE